MNRECGNVGEHSFLRKRRTRNIELGVRTSVVLHRFDRETGECVGRSERKLNTMEAGGIDLFLQLITGDSTKHLDATNATIVINSAGGVYTGSNVFLQKGTDAGPTNGTTTKSAPTAAYVWEFHDISASTRTNQNTLEFWYEDPNAAPGSEVKISQITVSEGTKPSTENWQWSVYMELYSTDTDFTSSGLQDLLELIAGDRSLHMDETDTWFRPFTSSDVGLDSSGQQPDAAPSVDTSANTITLVWTVVDGDYEGAWDKTEISLSVSAGTYSGTVDIRYGGCKTNGDGCGTKGAGEEWEYTYVLTLAQGS